MPTGISASVGGPGEFFGPTWSERPVSDLFLFGFGRAACISENRSGTLNPRDDDGSLVPPGDTGSSRRGGPARASPTQSRTAAPPRSEVAPPNAGDLPTKSLRDRSPGRY